MCPAPVTKDLPRGFIIPIGGGEDRVKESKIHRRFVKLAGGSDAHIVVIPTASEFEATGAEYLCIFQKIGAGRVEFLPINSRADCENIQFAEMLDKATGIFLTGGNQLRLSAILGGTLIAQKIRRRNAAGVPVAGTSAGASIMCKHMVAGGDSGVSPAEASVILAPGLGLTNALIIDQHFTQRNRLGRLLAASSYNPFLIGLGIDEDTAAFIGPDNIIEVVGRPIRPKPDKIGKTDCCRESPGQPVLAPNSSWSGQMKIVSTAVPPFEIGAGSGWRGLYEPRDLSGSARASATLLPGLCRRTIITGYVPWRMRCLLST